MCSSKAYGGMQKGNLAEGMHAWEGVLGDVCEYMQSCCQTEIEYWFIDFLIWKSIRP